MKPFPSGRGRGPVATLVRPAQRYAALVLDGCLHRPPTRDAGVDFSVAGVCLDIEKEPINCKSKHQISDRSFMTVDTVIIKMMFLFWPLSLSPNVFSVKAAKPYVDIILIR